ncbi:hypothetical protein L3Y34_005938 [Caenorhabditis briggsae]|uniref:BTB domain-containing protein n=2 Tax=Caenorhabditis briggsae TaxID=6238 RepID=A0AAE9CY83_CAEBR|nr:hypothetical protein L3Y34_005938 [Caenorhabditis briggsae]
MNNFYPKGLKMDFCTVPLMEPIEKIDLGFCGTTRWEFIVEKKEETLSVALNCEPNVLVRLQHQEGDKNAQTASGFDVPFDKKDEGNNWEHTFDKVNEKNGFVQDGKVMFQINIGISKIDDLYSGDFIDFSVPRGSDTDIVLVVAQKKFHVSKQILSIHSQYFQAMFYGNFNESKMGEIPIAAVDLNAFHIFLQYIHMAPIKICAENVSQLLMMGDLFGVKKLMRECENFLLRKDVDETDFFDLAVFHNLDRVLCEKINEKSVEELTLWWSMDPKLPPAAMNFLTGKLGTGVDPKENDEPEEKYDSESTSSTSEEDSDSNSDSESDSDA